MNIYQQVLSENLSRLVNCFNLDRFSSTYGYADRQYWGWKTSDFPNSTMQGGIHALAIANSLGLYTNDDQLIPIVDSSIDAVARSRSGQGGLAEAYPNENSFCVTALIAFDCLSAINILKDRHKDWDYDRHLPTIEGLIQFITRNDESHAVISNHLATGVAAITLWNDLTNASSSRNQELLEVIYRNQSAEGWYKEYEGPDPGYQTLCLYYLAAAQRVLKDPDLQNSIDQSVDFLSYFVHPDGTIGGLYGSRNTEVFYPGGLVDLAKSSSQARAMVSKFESTFELGRQILPQAIDIGNFVPLLNSYAYAAAEPSIRPQDEEGIELPFTNEFERDFQEGGIHLKSTSRYYSITNYKKGGTIKVFDKDKGQLDIEDGGLVGELNNGRKFSTQSWNEDHQFEDKTVHARFYRFNEEYPSSFQFIILRFLAITVLRNRFLGASFKKMVVKRLMTGKRALTGGVIREFRFGDDQIVVNQTVTQPPGCQQMIQGGDFRAIHMASSGYNEIGGEVGESRLVEFSRNSG